MIGIHVSKNTEDIVEKRKYKNLYDAIIGDVNILNMSALQVFVSGPRSKTRINMNHQGIKQYCTDNNLALYVHGTYISVSIWHVNESNRSERASIVAMTHIREQLIDSKQLGAKGLIIHVPRHTTETVINTMSVLSDCRQINSLRKNSKEIIDIILEMPASRPYILDDIQNISTTVTYETPEKLNYFTEQLINAKNITLNWSLCLDTCHLWAGGIDFSQDIAWIDYELKLSDLVKGKISLIHLNGAMAKNFGTGKDEHIIPFSRNDAIWGKYISEEMRNFVERTSSEELTKINLYEKMSKKEIDIIKSSSIYSIIKFCVHKNISMICEINRQYFNDVKFALDIINGLILSAR